MSGIAGEAAITRDIPSITLVVEEEVPVFMVHTDNLIVSLSDDEVEEFIKTKKVLRFAGTSYRVVREKAMQKTFYTLVGVLPNIKDTSEVKVYGLKRKTPLPGQRPIMVVGKWKKSKN